MSAPGTSHPPLHHQLPQQQQSTRRAAAAPRRAEDIIHVLRDRIALLPGARDRRHRPVLFVPSREANAPTVNPDHLRNLLHYLHDVTADDAKEQGFVFVIDMRKGTTWSGWVKPVLKCLQEHFPGPIADVFIIKPERFWEKHKTSASSGKYSKFDVQMLSVETLIKHIDVAQIPREMSGGSLLYDHDEWIDARVDFENLEWRTSECLRLYETYRNAISNSESPVDVATAKEAITEHQHLHSMISAVPIDNMEAELQQLQRRVFPADAPTANNGGSYPTASSYSTPNGVMVSMNGGGSGVHPNPDLAYNFPNLVQRLKQVFHDRSETMQLWERRKRELDRCCQVKLFEQDAENFCRLIRSQFAQISQRFTEIGGNEQETEHFLKEHMRFSSSINKIEVSYNHLLNDGKRLRDMGMEQLRNGDHEVLESDKLEGLSNQLEEEWRRLWLRIDQRTKLLNLALSFQKKCNLFLKNSESWLSNVGVDPSLVVNRTHDEMRRALSDHDQFESVFETVYTEAYADAMNLSKTMKKLFGEHVGQAPSYRQVLEVIQRITQMRRQIHGIWKSRREEIHFCISSAVFTSDMRSVLEWLEQHGEPFLRRKTAIGHDRASVQSLSVNHENFRAVAMNTYRNANQLFAMAEELKNSSGSDELDSEEAVATLTELRRKIDSFRKKVDLRTQLLFLASNFFLHYDEIMAWYGKLDERATRIGVVYEQVEECERNRAKIQSENEGTHHAFERVVAEANQLRAALQHQRVLLSTDNSEAVHHVDNLVAAVEGRHIAERDRWPAQLGYLNASLKVSAFLRDCSEITKQLLSWREDLKGLKHSVGNKADIVMHYHRQNTESVRNVVLDAMNQMNEITHVRLLDSPARSGTFKMFTSQCALHSDPMPLPTSGS